jgi:hypothetical protein
VEHAASRRGISCTSSTGDILRDEGPLGEAILFDALEQLLLFRGTPAALVDVRRQHPTPMLGCAPWRRYVSGERGVDVGPRRQ